VIHCPGLYLSKLCESLAGSLTGDTRPVTLRPLVDDGTVLSKVDIVSEPKRQKRGHHPCNLHLAAD
jgi:hypothetical protein